MSTTTTMAPRPKAQPAQVQQMDLMVTQLEQLAQEYGPAALAPLSTIARSMKLARGVQQARELVTQVVPHIRHLAGSQLGFRTDKDNGGRCGYDDAVLTECLTEAVLRGVSWVGNQFNIIAGRCYITKEGYQFLVRDIHGLTDLVMMPGVPKGSEGGAVVPYKACWKLHGKAQSLERQIPVRLNSGMGADGAIGKATRKMLASIFAQCTGSTQSAADAEDDPTEPAEAAPVPGRAAALAEKMKAGAAAVPDAVVESPPPAPVATTDPLTVLLAELDNLAPVEMVDAEIRKINPEITSRRHFGRLTAEAKAALVAGLTAFKSNLEAA